MLRVARLFGEAFASRGPRPAVGGGAMQLPLDQPGDAAGSQAGTSRSGSRSRRSVSPLIRPSVDWFEQLSSGRKVRLSPRRPSPRPNLVNTPRKQLQTLPPPPAGVEPKETAPSQTEAATGEMELKAAPLMRVLQAATRDADVLVPAAQLPPPRPESEAAPLIASAVRSDDEPISAGLAIKYVGDHLQHRQRMTGGRRRPRRIL